MVAGGGDSACQWVAALCVAPDTPVCADCAGCGQIGSPFWELSVAPARISRYEADAESHLARSALPGAACHALGMAASVAVFA